MHNAQKILTNIIQEHGPGIVHQDNRLKSFILDHARGEFVREVNLWFLIISEGMLSDIAKSKEPSLLVSCLAKELHDKYGTDSSVAEWAVTSWYNALNFKEGQPPLETASSQRAKKADINQHSTEQADAFAENGSAPHSQGFKQEKIEPSLIELPFKSVIVRMLDDQTAVVGGVGGELAAIDVRTGDVLDLVIGIPGMGRARPGGGEIKYPQDCFYFMESAPQPQCVWTMSHDGTLKTWHFNGKFNLVNTVELLDNNFDVLHQAISKRKSSRNWSCWTCYSRDLPAEVPEGIVAAKLSPDRNSIVCLTDWFAIFRCNLIGVLQEAPLVVPDAFAIEPANHNSSEVWVGVSAFRSNVVSRRRLSDGKVLVYNEADSSFDCNGIHQLGANLLVGDRSVHRQNDLTLLRDTDYYAGSCKYPLVLPNKRLVLCVLSQAIHVFNVETLKVQGLPLLAGHDDGIMSIAASRDESTIVSISVNFLRSWDLDSRQPIGGYPNTGMVLYHGLQNHTNPAFQSSDGSVVIRSHGLGNRAIAIDLDSQTSVPLNISATNFGAVFNINGQSHLFDFKTRKTEPPKGIKGALFKALGVPKKEDTYLYHVVSTPRGDDESEVLMQGRDGTGFYPKDYQFAHIDGNNIVVLNCGHLAIYHLQTHAFTCGPTDISGPSDEAIKRGASWHLYSSLAVSADRTRLYVRAYGRPILVFCAKSLSMIGEIVNSADDNKSVVAGPTSDSVFFTKKGENYKDDLFLGWLNHPPTRVATLESGFCYSGSRSAVMLPSSHILAIINYKNVDFIDTNICKYLEYSLDGHVDSVDSIHISPNGQWLMSTSQDGTCRFWQCADILRHCS